MYTKGLIGAVLLALALTGCGGDTASQDTSTTKANQTTQAAAPKKDPVKQEIATAIGMVVNKKEQLPADEDEWRPVPETVFSVTVSNSSGKDIRAFKGILHIKDKKGRELISAEYKDTDPIAAGETRQHEISMTANPSDETDTLVYNTPLTQLKIDWEPDTIFYADGRRIGDVKYLIVQD